jgi:hypothetical protein
MTPHDFSEVNSRDYDPFSLKSDRLLIWNDPSSVKCATSASFVFGEAEQTAAEASKCDG